MEALNRGLTRVVSTRTYPKRRKQFVSKNTKGRVFRVGVLHAKELEETTLLRNRRGFVNAQMNTVAHAPSMYHWLYHRCGIPFEESRAYLQTGSLKVDDVVVTNPRDLESQLDWSTFQQLDIQVRSSLPALCAGRPPGDDSRATEEKAAQLGPWVPALKRALHRTYGFMYVHPGLSMSSDVADPKSFVHRLAPFMGPHAAVSSLGLNVLRPIGFMNSMRGLGIVSNDVAVIRYWNNEFLGNYGTYDIRFPRGTPKEVIHRAAAEMEKALSTGPRQQLPESVSVPCRCTLASSPHASKDGVARLFQNTPLEAEHIVVSTPLMPYRVVQRTRKAGGLFTLTRSGPFALPPDLSRPGNVFRPMSAAELAMFFTFERQLKTARVVLSLREFDQHQSS